GPPQAPRSSQAATQPAASEPGHSAPPPAQRSKRTKAEPAAEPTKGKGKAQGKAAEAKTAPQPGRWLDRDCNAALNMQRIGESRWRPLELCCWPEQGKLPAKGKEYPGLGYNRLSSEWLAALREAAEQTRATRPADWEPPAGQVEHRLVRPAWSQQRDQPVRGLMWCPVVAPRKPPQAPRSSQAATQPAASEPGPNELKPSQPHSQAALNMQLIWESRWRPLELCYWPEQGKLPAKGKEYPGLGYKRVRDKPPKTQPAVAQYYSSASVRAALPREADDPVHPGLMTLLGGGETRPPPFPPCRLPAPVLLALACPGAWVYKRRIISWSCSNRPSSALSITTARAHSYSGAYPVVVTSLANELCKHCVRLRAEKAYRDEHGDTTRQPTTAFHTVFLVADPSSPVSPSWPAWVKAARRVLVSAGVMQKMMGVQSAGGVTLAAELDLPPPPDLQAWGCGQGRVPPHLTRLLVLDGVQDPGNLGSLARSALGFGFQALYLLPSCCDPWNDKAIRASQGAVLRIPIFRQGSLSHLLQTAQQHNLALVAAALPQDLPSAPTPFPGPHLKARGVALVLGSEGQGLSKEVMQLAWLQVIKVPEGAVLRGCKKTRRKLREHLRLRAEIHSQLRVIASLFVSRIFLTCLVGYPTPGCASAPQPPAVQPPQPPDAPPLPPLTPRAPAQPAPAQPASMECDNDSDSESDCGSEPEPQSDSESEQLGLTKETRAAFTSEPALSHHWARWFNTNKLRNKEFHFERQSAQPLGCGIQQQARRDTERWLAPIKPRLQHLAAASSAGTSLEANLKHITVTLATWDAVWEVYLDPKWARQRLRLYGAQDRALEQFFNKLEEHMAELSMKRHGCAKQLVVFFGAATIGTGGGWGADAVLRACRKVVCRPRGKDQDGGRVVLVDEHRTSRVSSAVNGKQPCEVELNTLSATRPAGWKPPAGQVEPRLVRPAWSQERGQPVRGPVWCLVVAPRKPPQAPRSGQAATQPAASEPGPNTPPPAKRSKPAAEPTKGKGKGKAAKAKPTPQPGRWLDRDCNAALNMQRIGESRWRPLELCYWPDQGALPAKRKEYPGLGYKRLRDKPPKAQEQQQQPAEAQ
ncbi:hypothetical protein QJQ45_016418, partial [Haematococcus lacustris]